MSSLKDKPYANICAGTVMRKWKSSLGEARRLIDGGMATNDKKLEMAFGKRGGECCHVLVSQQLGEAQLLEENDNQACTHTHTV